MGKAFIDGSRVSYTGGSITTRAVQGYQRLNGSEIWAPPYYGGGDDDAWIIEGGKWWTNFDAKLALKPTPEVHWHQVAVHSGTFDEVYGHVCTFEQMFRQRLPKTPIFMSGMNTYDPPLASIDPEVSWAVAERVVADGLALEGPDMQSVVLTLDLRTSVKSAHQNKNGQDLCGQVLLDFDWTAA